MCEERQLRHRVPGTDRDHPGWRPAELIGGPPACCLTERAPFGPDG
ncbi:hypothetical protein [Streptomyces sp. NPDC006309]